MAKEGYKVTFTPPAGFPVPEGTEAGDTFQFTGEIKVEDDGTFCLLTMDGVPLEEEGVEEEVVEEPAAPPTMAEAAKAHRDGGYMM